MNKKRLILFILVAALGVLSSHLLQASRFRNEPIVVYGAVGGGKEGFLGDADVNRILLEKYNIKIVSDAWSNSKLITDSLVYTAKDGSKKDYDYVFFSDERFYEYYRTPAKSGEAPRNPILTQKIALYTPIVYYTWQDVCEALIHAGIATYDNGVYYLSDMKSLIGHVNRGSQWSELGVRSVFGAVGIASADPISSSPGTTYYGLLANILVDGIANEATITGALPQLADYNKNAGPTDYTPADLFNRYLNLGRGSYPMIVDYEKSIIEFAYNNPDSYNAVKDNICIVYPEPTMWNSHCIMSFSVNGNTYAEALSDPEIQKIAWERYGFRSSGTPWHAETSVQVDNLAKEINYITFPMKKEVYDIMIEGLK